MKGISSNHIITGTEFVNVKCPYCENKIHKYDLKVKRLKVFYTDAYGMESGFIPKYEKHHFEKFLHLFICPEKSLEFQAEIELQVSREDLVKEIV